MYGNNIDNKNIRRNEILYRYCKDEGLDYEYILNEWRKEERKTRLCPELLKKLLIKLRALFLKS